MRFLPLLSGKFGRWPLWVLLGQLLFLQQPSFADVWGYIDERGVAHFANDKVDGRYEIFYKGSESLAATAPSSVEPIENLRPVAVPMVPAKLLAFLDVSPNFKAIKHHLREASNLYKVDYELLQALIAAESGFDTLAVSPKGAIGLMQLMPRTARRYGVDGDRKEPLEKKLTDPMINVHTGARYLRDLIAMFPGQLELAVAAYNAGEGAVQKAGNKIPNFKETQAYVKTVMQIYTGLKPPQTLSTERQRMPARLHMEMPGGAAGRSNMLAPFDLSASVGGGAFPNTVPGSHLAIHSATDPFKAD
jgi:soluble lytic murein transglycosylase-like protein